MGIRNDGQLNYGIPFDEGMEFPWDEEKFEGDIEVWWVVINGGPIEPDNITTPDGRDWLPGGQEQHDVYLEEKRNFLNDNPLPIKLVTYCSYEYPMYLIGSPHLSFNAARGEAVKVNRSQVVVEDNYKNIIIDFCDKYGIDMPCEPGWYLTSLYG